MNKIQILITDSHKLDRENLTYVLNSDSRFQVMTECTMPEEAVALTVANRPDVILMSIAEPAHGELGAIQKICNISPASAIVGISSNPSPAFVKRMMQSGVRGYVTRNSSKEEMIGAILEVSQGNKYICSEVKNKAAELLFSDQQVPEHAVLTKREVQVINCLREGLSSREMADKLEISLRTVEVHRYNILRKLKLKNAASVINFMNNNAAFAWTYGNVS